MQFILLLIALLFAIASAFINSPYLVEQSPSKNYLIHPKECFFNEGCEIHFYTNDCALEDVLIDAYLVSSEGHRVTSTNNRQSAIVSIPEFEYLGRVSYFDRLASNKQFTLRFQLPSSLKETGYLGKRLYISVIGRKGDTHSSVGPKERIILRRRNTILDEHPKNPQVAMSELQALNDPREILRLCLSTPDTRATCSSLLTTPLLDFVKDVARALNFAEAITLYISGFLYDKRSTISKRIGELQAKIADSMNSLLSAVDTPYMNHGYDPKHISEKIYEASAKTMHKAVFSLCKQIFVATRGKINYGNLSFGINAVDLAVYDGFRQVVLKMRRLSGVVEAMYMRVARHFDEQLSSTEIHSLGSQLHAVSRKMKLCIPFETLRSGPISHEAIVNYVSRIGIIRTRDPLSLKIFG